jgi:T-complex protein 1 subunit zeta
VFRPSFMYSTHSSFLLTFSLTLLVSFTSLPSYSAQMSVAVVDAIQTIQTQDDLPLDLNRIELLTMQRQSSLDSRFVRGIVLDHGARHPNMPTLLQNVHILTCNLSLEYEQTETQAGFVYSTAAEREKLVESERKWLDERCQKIIALKRQVCSGDNNKSFCIINQKGVDPLSLDIFAKEGILCLRRAKRRNMERLTLACGGQIVLSVADLDVAHLGFAGQVTEVTYGDDKYTFVEDCGATAQACTLLLQGPNQLTVDQVKDAVKDGLRAVKNVIEDKAVVPGAGAFEIAASLHLTNVCVPKTSGKIKLGMQAFAEALLIIPKTLIANSGYDVQEALLQLKEERESTGMAVGFNCATGEPMLPAEEGVWDNVRVKRQSLHLCTVLANQLLLVDEVMRAGKQMGKAKAQAEAAGGSDPMQM